MAGKPKDLTGQRFGMLTVLQDSGKRARNREALWLCKCECGNEKVVSGTDLRRCAVKSCGCLGISNGKKVIAFNKANFHKDGTNLSLIKEGNRLKKIIKVVLGALVGISPDVNG